MNCLKLQYSQFGLARRFGPDPWREAQFRPGSCGVMVDCWGRAETVSKLTSRTIRAVDNWTSIWSAQCLMASECIPVLFELNKKTLFLFPCLFPTI